MVNSHDYHSFKVPIQPKMTIISDALRDLVSSVQLKKLEKQSWTRVTFSKVAGNFTESNTPP